MTNEQKEVLELQHGYRKSDVLLKLNLSIEALECHVNGNCFVSGDSIIEYPVEYALTELREIRYHIEGGNKTI